jgi:hypothetical protein
MPSTRDSLRSTAHKIRSFGRRSYCERGNWDGSSDTGETVGYRVNPPHHVFRERAVRSTVWSASFDVDARSAPAAVDLMAYGPDNALMYGLTPPDATRAMPSNLSIHRWDSADHLRGIASTYHVSAKTCLAECLVEQLQSLRGWNFNLPPAKKDWTYFSSSAAKDDWSAGVGY